MEETKELTPNGAPQTDVTTEDAPEVSPEGTPSIEEALDGIKEEAESAPDDGSDESEKRENDEEESKEEKEESETEQKPSVKKNKKTARERINELTFGKREAERLAKKAKEEAEYWKTLAEASKADSPSSRPVPDNYATVEDYEDDLYKWRRSQEIAAERERAEQAHVQRLELSFQEKAARVKSEHEDFDEIIQAPVFSPIMTRQIYESDYGPEIGYFLGLPNNRAYAKQIASLPPERQIAEIAKLDVRLSEARPLKTTNSTPPIKPVGNTATVVKSEKDMSTEEWMKHWNKKKRERLEAKYARK